MVELIITLVHSLRVGIDDPRLLGFYDSYNHWNQLWCCGRLVVRHYDYITKHRLDILCLNPVSK